MTLVLSANNISSDTEYILRGKSFTYILNNIDPGIDPWGNPCFSVPQSETTLLVVLGYLLQLSSII
jgi:hypothetical protein